MENLRTAVPPSFWPCLAFLRRFLKSLGSQLSGETKISDIRANLNELRADTWLKVRNSFGTFLCYKFAIFLVHHMFKPSSYAIFTYKCMQYWYCKKARSLIFLINHAKNLKILDNFNEIFDFLIKTRFCMGVFKIFVHVSGDNIKILCSQIKI